MTIDREELRRLCDAATPGRWYARNLEYGLEGEDAEFAAAARTAVPALLDALEAAEAQFNLARAAWIAESERACSAEEREERLLAAVKNIAKQRLHAEITDCDPDEIDWLSGYEGCVKEARAALAETAP